MKTSDHEILWIRNAVALDDGDNSGRALEKLIGGVIALRKVADAALALERAMEGIPCECVDKSCEVMCKALREAGL